MKKIINLLFFLIPLFAIVIWVPVVLTYIWIMVLSFSLENSHYEMGYPYTIVILILALTTIPILVYFFLKTFKKLQLGVNLLTSGSKKQRSLYVGFLIFCAGLLFLFGFIVYDFWNERPPQLFPFDDSEGTYYITKRYDTYFINYKSTSEKNSFYNCYFEKGRENCQWEVDKEVSDVYIGKANVELEQFIGKEVKINGEFVYDDRQCIAGKCREIPRADVLKIDSIQEAP